METRRDAFQAIADPTRRAIIHMLAGKTMNLNTLADNFEISRPAISRHIRILSECGMLIIKKQGRERYCTSNPEPLDEVTAWIEKYRAFWTHRLEVLDTFLKSSSSNQEKSKKHGKRK